MGFMRIKKYRLGDTWLMSYNVLYLGIISYFGIKVRLRGILGFLINMH
jgi:hypothetical protein